MTPKQFLKRINKAIQNEELDFYTEEDSDTFIQTSLQFETDPYTAVIPGLEKDIRTGKYKPETADSIRTADPLFLSTLDEAIRTFGNMSDFRAINLLHSHSIWEKALEQGYNKPFNQKLFLED